MTDRYASLKQGLVGCWIPSISGSGLLLPDVSGRGNNGVLTNMDASDWVSGQYGRALDFDGTDDYVETNLIQPSSVFTVTGFVAVDSFANSPLIYTWIGPSGTDRGFLETNSTGTQLYFGIRNTQASELSSRFYTLSQSLEAGKFFHFATVKTPGIDTGELYVNGIRQTNFTGQLYSTPGAGNLRLAAYHTVNALFLDGRLDDIRVYDRPLTEPEIKLLASEPGIGYKPAKKLSRFSQRYTYEPPPATQYGVVRQTNRDQANLREGLVGAWCPSIAGSGLTLPDLSGRNNHGTLTNMDASDWVSAQYGRALDFDGVNDFIELGNYQEANFGTGPYTIALWMRAAPFAAQKALLAKDDWDLGTTGVLIYSDTGAPNVIYAYVSGTTGVSYGAIADSTWHHIALVRQSTGSNQTFAYLDGRIIATATDTTNYSNSRRLRIANDDDGNRAMLVRVDDVRLYRRALTPAEIRLLASRPGIGLVPERRRTIQFQQQQFSPAWSRRQQLIGSGVY